MKIILRADVDNLGRLGEVVTVKPGYGRNYLIPKGMAMLATEGNMRVFEQERKKLQEKMDAIRSASMGVAEKIAAAEVVITVRVGEGDKLYGSVTTANIADKLEELGIEVDKRKIVLDEPIKELGDYQIEIKLHPDVKAELKVSVVKLASEEGQQESDVAEPESIENEIASEEAEQESDEAEQEEE